MTDAESRAGYVLAMAVLQSDAWITADDELQEAVRYFTLKPGFHWVQSVMNGAWVQEADGTPFTSSVASETYWSS